MYENLDFSDRTKSFPEVFILSTQRSGTHLLLSCLNKHSKIHGRGEIFEKFKRGGIIEDNIPDKINIGILMYVHFDIYNRLGGDLKNHKIIHLLRDPLAVALSRLQREADKKKMGSIFKPHYHKDSPDERKLATSSERGIVDTIKADKLAMEIESTQKKYINQLKNIPHLEIHYEELVPDNKGIEQLSPQISELLLNYLDLKNDVQSLFTTYIKTGIRYTD